MSFNADNKVRVVILFFAIQNIGNGKTKIRVLDVALHFVHLFNGACHLLLPGNRIQMELCLASPASRSGNGDEIGARPARAFNDLVGDTLFGKLEVALRLVIGRVDDGIFDDDLFHNGDSSVS